MGIGCSLLFRVAGLKVNAVSCSSVPNETGVTVEKKQLIEQLEAIRHYATLETASFGFPDDRLEIKSVLFGGDDRGRVGDVIHPDTYIKSITKCHHESWIIRPLDEIIGKLRSESLTAAKPEMTGRELEFLDIVARQRDTIDKLVKRVERLESKNVMTEVIGVQ